MSIAERIKKFFRVVDQTELDLSRDAYQALEVKYQHLAEALPRLHFLLLNAPLMNLPMERDRLGRVGTKFAYIHPNTFSKVTGVPRGALLTEGRIHPGTTRCIYTVALPEGAVIFTNNAMPGLENANAK